MLKVVKKVTEDFFEARDYAWIHYPRTDAAALACGAMWHDESKCFIENVGRFDEVGTRLDLFKVWEIRE